MSHLQRITRKIPPRAEHVNALKRSEQPKERNYLYMQSDHGDKTELHLLKRLVDKQLDKDQKELLSLADRLGYPSPHQRKLTMRNSHDIQHLLIENHEEKQENSVGPPGTSRQRNSMAIKNSNPMLLQNHSRNNQSSQSVSYAVPQKVTRQRHGSVKALS